jgi:hypothetical protein
MEQYLADFGTTVATIIIITQFLKTYIFKTEGNVTRFMSWGVSILVAVFGFYTNLGWFAHVSEIYWAILWGLGLGMATNGIFDGLMIQQIINVIIGMFPKGIQKVFVVENKLFSKKVA